ncbi:MAG TPA: PA2779 family protein, partial [Woeseiaceae bacterium]
MNRFNAAVMSVVIVAMLGISLPVHASIVGTEQMVAEQTRTHALDTINGVLASAEVAAQLEAWGVPAATVSERVAALSDQELQELAGTIENDPAGGVLGVIGLVFVVLIILEIVGVTNIFRNT